MQVEMNGKEERPTGIIVVRWDEVTQSVMLDFDSKEFRTWSFVEAVLGMAKELAEVKGKVAVMQQVQRAAQQQAVDQRIAQKILHG